VVRLTSRKRTGRSGAKAAKVRRQITTGGKRMDSFSRKDGSRQGRPWPRTVYSRTSPSCVDVRLWSDAGRRGGPSGA
jgi:hypothetical protein